MEPLISIVIPVYNAGVKINPCMKSLLAQTYNNIEIILVDDKSPDKETVRILREWVKKDSRVRLLEKDVNGGPRLDGIRMAKGEYIVFADQDDWMPKDAIEKMYNAAVEFDADLVVGQNSKAIKMGPIVHSFAPKHLFPHTGEVLEHDDLMEEYFESYFGHNILPVTVWGKLYKKDLFDRSEIPSPWPNTGAGDLILSMHLHPYIKRLVIIPNVVYFYLIGLPGASPKYLNGWLARANVLFEHKWSMLEKYNYQRGFNYQAIEMVNYIKTFVRDCTIFDVDNRKERIRELTETLNNPIWQRVQLLLGTEYKEQKLVYYILEKNAQYLYEELEKQFSPDTLIKKMKYSLLRASVKFK